MCWRVRLGAGAVLATPQQPPGSRVTSPCHLPGWKELSLSTALGAQTGVARTAPQCSQKLSYFYASKNPKLTQQKFPTPKKWVTTTNWPSVRKIYLHTTLPWVSPGWGSPWTIDPSPGNGRGATCHQSANYPPSPLLIKQPAGSWPAQSEQGFS